MSTIRVLICAGAFGSALFFGSFAAADAVDDLLAGKPVVITPAAPNQAPAAPQPPVLERMLHRSVDEAEPLGVTLELTNTSDTTFPAATTNTANMNLVPEPSAIIFAGMSLAYFMVFFRRRYSL